MARVCLNDWIPLYVDSGVMDIIRSLARYGYDEVAFMAAFNTETQLPAISWEQFKQLYADLQLQGELLEVQIDPDAAGIPPAIERYTAPAGLGVDTTGVWFSTPEMGTEYVRWYVNGTLVLRREQELSSNRSATLAELTAQSGDVVQIAIEAGSVVGWWARIEV